MPVRGEGEPVAVFLIGGGEVVARLGLEGLEDVQPGLDVVLQEGHLIAARMEHERDAGVVRDLDEALEVWIGKLFPHLHRYERI